MVFIFYLTAFIYSWSIWILGMTVGKSMLNPYVLVSLGGLGPVAGLLVYLKFSENTQRRKNYLKRLVQIQGSSKFTWLIAISAPFVIVLLANFLDYVIVHKTLTGFHLFSLDKDFLASGFLYPIFLIFFGPIPEEMGWRGAAFEELLHRLNYFKAQLLAALLWAIWHIPLFYIPGSYQNDLGLYTTAFWMFFINVVLVSFITGWIYVRSNRSILMAIVFHYTINLSGEMFPSTEQIQAIKLVLFCILAVVLEISINPSTKTPSNRILRTRSSQ